MNFRKEELIQRPPGWLSAWPLEKFSSLHELSAMGFLGLNAGWLPSIRFFIQFNCNLNTSPIKHPNAHFIFDTRDATQPPSFPGRCFSIVELQRWRLQLTNYPSYEDFLCSLNNGQKQTNAKAEKKFKSYGCRLLWLKDWAKYAENVYELYSKVAHKHGDNWLYDLHFFQTVATRQEYELISVWYEDKMIGAFLLLDESPILHGFVCGVDYEHSTPSCTYSWVNHELIKYAFEKKYQILDVGISSDECKKSIGFKSVQARMDIYSKGAIARKLLQAASLFITGKINSDGKFVCQFRFLKT